MADLSKCRDDTCPSRTRCWRYLAPDSRNQSWASFNRQADEQHCKYFWPVDAAKKTESDDG